MYFGEWIAMPEKIFQPVNGDTKDKERIDELTKGEIYDVSKPIILSDELKNVFGSDLGLLIVNKESKAVRIIKLNSTDVHKLVINLQNPTPFITKIIEFYKKNKIKIVYTTGICFKGKKLEDCVYESYIDLKETPELTEFHILEELENINGVEKIFIIPIKQNV